MCAKVRQKARKFPVPKDRYVYLTLILVSVLIRIPFLRSFDLVAYDGTFYINQARSFWGALHTSGAYPIGYPALIALFLPLVRDGVRAAQVVSFAASLGSVCILYALGMRVASRLPAFLASLLLALTPLFVRFSLMTMSESACMFWTLLGLLFFATGRDLRFGLSMGMAVITRPEVLGVFGVLAILRRRPWRRLVLIATSFLVVYTLNLIVLSKTLGHPVILPKTGAFGASVSYWKGREVWGDFAGREELESQMREEAPSGGILADYIRRLPGEVVLLGRHVMPIAFLLALYGILRKRIFLLAGFVPFVVFPIFADRVDPRYILPYVPIVFLYAAVGMENISGHRLRVLTVVLLIMSMGVGLVVNRGLLTRPVSDGFQWAKKAGAALDSRIQPADKVAGRKPFFAFYAGGAYIEIPVAPYDEAIQGLLDRGMKFLSLHRTTVHNLRPALRPLLYDRAFINGELRLKQIYEYPGEQLLYERALGEDPLKRSRITSPIAGALVAASWSPDGEMIAYRQIDSSGGGGIFVIPPDGGQTTRLIGDVGMADPLTWSPDSKRIAFANSSEGNIDIYAYEIHSGELERLTSDDAVDTSPSWSVDGTELVFCSDRSGDKEIWSKNLETGEFVQITTDGGNGFPSLSPEGDRIAWIRKEEGVVVLDRVTGRKTVITNPRHVSFAPAWSPDGRIVAVTGQGSGGADVYFAMTDGSSVLALTKTSSGDGMPTWSPDGRQMAIVTNEEGDFGLWVLTGLEAYVERLESPIAFGSFEPPR